MRKFYLTILYILSVTILFGCQSINDTVVVTFMYNEDILYTVKIKRGDCLSTV